MKVEKWAHDLLFVLAEEATEEFAGRLPGPELHRLSEAKPNKFEGFGCLSRELYSVYADMEFMETYYCFALV